MEYANTLSGSDMLPLVKIEKDYGADKVIDLLERAGRVRDPSLTLSVGHQAKGLEWGRVRIGEDFAMPSTEAARQQSLDSGDPPPREPTEEENRLLYVCLTRAMDILDDSNVEYRGYFERLGDLPPPSGRKFASAIDEAESMLDEGCSKSELRGRVVHAISDVASPERRELLANVASDIVLSEAKLRDGAHTFA
ncbi:MAG: hypothetical protein DDT34_01152 [Firmicutes bacterium]|nr:hypothetical protein [Bacillota bacterium]